MSNKFTPEELEELYYYAFLCGYVYTKAYIKGGDGSGNFGHAGRPGLVGGSAEGGVFYHGTTSAAAETIKQNGLEISKASRNSKKGKVYITSSKDNAAYWAEDKLDYFGLDRNETDLVIFEIRVPAGVQLDRDTQSSSENDFVHVGNIPPEWIIGYTTISLKSETGASLYLPVLFNNGKFYI